MSELSDALHDSIVTVLGEQCDSVRLHRYIDGASQLDADLWRIAGDLGWLGAGVPEEHGGLGLGPGAPALILADLGRFCAPGPYLPTMAASVVLACCAHDDRARTLLQQIAEGKLVVAVPAVPDGAPLALRDDRVAGSLMMLGGDGASLALVPVTSGGERRWGLVTIDGHGARLCPRRMWDRTRSLGRLDCVGAEVDVLSAAGDEDVGQALLVQLALGLASDSVGAAEAILGKTIDYLKQRIQFGKPLASFQALKHRVANLKLHLETARHLTDQAVEAAEQGSDHLPMWALLAKAEATDAFAAIAADCVQLSGGVGQTWEYDCHIYLKRAKLNQQLGGANDHLRDAAAAMLDRAGMQSISTAELAL